MKISLSWTPGAGNVTSNVYRSTTQGGPYQKIASALGGSTFDDPNIVGGTKYFYVVTGVDATNNESAFSNEASALAAGVAAPTGLSAVFVP